MTFKILKVNHYQELTKVLPTKLTIRPKEVKVLIPENVDLLYYSIQEPIWKEDLKNQMMEVFSIMENR